MILGCGLIYLSAALIALKSFATRETPAAIWFATGFLVAVIIIVPKRLWPGVLAAAFVAGAAANFIAGKSLLLACSLGVVDALEGLLSGVLLSFLGPNITFNRLRDLTGLVFLSAILGNGVAALAGAASFTIFAGTPFWTSWRLWWLSNGIGIVTLAPLLVSFFRSSSSIKRLRADRIAEAGALLITLIFLSIFIFGHVSWSSIALPYLVFPLLIWAALRFGVLGASVAAVVMAALAIWYTNNGMGPFAIVSVSEAEKLLQVQSFVAAALACSLVPATVISERKEAEENLRRSESRLEVAQEIAGVGSFVLDPQGANSKWSEQMFRIMGRDRSAKEPSFREFLMWVHPEDRERVQESYDRMFREQKPFEIDYRYICPDGSWKYLHAIARPERDARSNRMVAFGTLMDMTERRRIEEQLRQAQKMEAVGRLAGGVAHDFNNLLGVIIGYSELALADMKDGDPLKSRIEPISKAAVRAAGLTSQLLAFSRRQVLKAEELDLNRVVTDLEKMLKRVIGEEIEVITDLQNPLPLVKADPGQMDQVILNLAVNSRDAMPNGGKLRIKTNGFTCRTTPSGYSGKIPKGEYVMLTVSDTGHGMDGTTKAHIFEPFFTTKEKGKGTGLGLATVYGIVSQSNGYIWAESVVGKGTDMHIVLPAIRPKKRVEPMIATEVTGTHERKEIVLLVEDEEPLRELVSRVVTSMGCTVVEAVSCDDAIRLAQNHSVDILLTDVVMPKMDGFELAKRVCDIRPNIKVLYMSGYSDEMVNRYLQSNSRPNFIQKPFKPSELRKRLQEIMDAPQGANR